MRQNRVHLMPPMSNFYARICVKATPSSNSRIQIVSGPHGVGKTTAVQQATEGLQVPVLFASCPQDARRSPV